MVKLNSHQLRDLTDTTLAKKVKRNPIYFILDNIYDTYNIGGLFRLADALAVEKLYICGNSEIPPNHKIVKASIGTYKVVPWVYKNTAVEAIDEIRDINSKVKNQKSKTQVKSQNFNYPIQIVAVEQDQRAISYTEFDYQIPLALVVGNETSGISQETLKACDVIIEIPMFGINKSLNVIVSTAIVSYHLLTKTIKKGYK